MFILKLYASQSDPVESRVCDWRGCELIPYVRHLCPSEMIHQESRTFESSPFDRCVRHFSKIFPADGRNVKGSIKTGAETRTQAGRGVFEPFLKTNQGNRNIAELLNAS